MPFVPISSRKPHALLLDHDKDRIRAQMQSKDEASVAEHYGLAPSSRGYRFGNHPMTRGPVRGPEVPFKEATRHWKPSEVEREGPMAKVDVKQAKVGAYWDGSHVKLAALRNCQSSPALQQSAAEVMQACHPLTTELRRWEKLAKVTERGEINEDVQSSMAASRKLCQAGVRPKPVFAGGLVNFPKYMLINNCHLKQMDLQRYADQCAEEVKPDLPMAQVSLARRGEASPSSSVRMQEPSWGAPKLKNHDQEEPCFAGNAMPSGRASRTSAWLRMG
ncbi:unnamed protein product [Durusdinium trenchii]|uniref:Uncharacterized protein n=1 Tax=Durusdinium trenchii TaxID=1381693 RepID=A0ABP0ME83_9DINO